MKNKLGTPVIMALIVGLIIVAIVLLRLSGAPQEPPVETVPQESIDPLQGGEMAPADSAVRRDAARAAPEIQLPVVEKQEPDPDLEVSDALGVYSDAELRDLASSSAEAAVVLARRTKDNEAAERLYERAVALSGKPGPLGEWIDWRDIGGMQHVNDELNVDRASLAYEIYLVYAKLGYAPEVVAEFERELTAAGVNLEPIRARAEQRFARLTAERQALVAADWPVQS